MGEPNVIGIERQRRIEWFRKTKGIEHKSSGVALQPPGMGGAQEPVGVL